MASAGRPHLVRDLEKAGLTDAATALADAFEAGGWDRGVGDDRVRVVPAASRSLSSISILLQGKIQDLILKDMVSARDEATPPEFKELVERYYEVLSEEGGEPVNVEARESQRRSVQTFQSGGGAVVLHEN